MRKILVLMLSLTMVLCSLSIVLAQENSDNEKEPVSKNIENKVMDNQTMDSSSEVDPKAVEYTVTFKFGYGDKVKTFTQKVEEGNLVIKPKDPTIENGVFKGWYGENHREFDFATPIEKDTILYAVFQMRSRPIPSDIVKVTFVTNGGTKVDSIQIGKGDNISEVRYPTKKGYEFIGWYTKEGKKWNVKNEIWEDMTLYAHWQKNQTDKDHSVKTNDNNLVYPVILFLILSSLSMVILRKKEQ